MFLICHLDDTETVAPDVEPTEPAPVQNLAPSPQIEPKSKLKLNRQPLIQ